MSNNDWQRVSQVLGVLLVVLVVAAAVVVITRPTSPGSASPSPTRLAVASPSGSVKPSPSRSLGASPSVATSPSPSASEEPSPSELAEPSPTPEITATPEVTETPVPTDTPEASPTEAPTAPSVGYRFKGLGFDDPQTSTTPTLRTLTFKSEGPGQVAAHLSHTSEGEVRLCLKRKGGSSDCREGSKIDLTAANEEHGKVTWIVTGIGTGASLPIADLRIVFHATRPQVSYDGFRFQGTQDTGFNGVEAEFESGTGSVHVDGHWDGAERPWHCELTNPDNGSSIADASGQGNDGGLDALTDVPRVHLSLANTEDFADQEVFLHGQIEWDHDSQPG